MRLIIKPAGLAVIVAAIVALAIISIGRQRHSAEPAPGSTPAAVSTPTAGGEPTSRVIPLAAGSSTPSSPTKTQEQELLSAPAVASESWNEIGGGGSADIRVYDSSLPNFPKLRRVHIVKLPEHLWDIQLRQSATGAIKEGAHLRVRVWARSKDSCPITVVCEHSAAPYEKLATRDFTLTPNWQEYDMEWTADRNVPANWAQVSLQLGAKVGEIDLAGASLTASTAVH